MEYYSAIKKNVIIPFPATWMDLEIFMLSERSDKYYMILIICEILKKNGTNESIYKTDRVTDRENKLMITKGESREGKNWETGINVYTCTHYYIKHR